IPISLVLIITSVSYILLIGDMTLMTSVPQKMFSGMDNAGLLAIPLFMLAGELMNFGGITTRLVSFAKVLIGHFRGGLAYVSILAPVIPPSMLIIIYGTLTGASIGDLFLAGIVPGILIGIGFIIIIGLMSKKNNFPKSERGTLKEILSNFFKVIPALLIPFIIIYGILSGMFTPTESAAVACIIAIIIGFSYKQLKAKDLPEIFLNTVTNTATITFLIVMANVFGFILAYEQIPQTL